MRPLSASIVEHCASVSVRWLSTATISRAVQPASAPSLVRARRHGIGSASPSTAGSRRVAGYREFGYVAQAIEMIAASRRLGRGSFVIAKAWECHPTDIFII